MRSLLRLAFLLRKKCRLDMLPDHEELGDIYQLVEATLGANAERPGSPTGRHHQPHRAGQLRAAAAHACGSMSALTMASTQQHAAQKRARPAAAAHAAGVLACVEEHQQRQGAVMCGGVDAPSRTCVGRHSFTCSGPSTPRSAGAAGRSIWCHRRRARRCGTARRHRCAAATAAASPGTQGGRRGSCSCAASAWCRWPSRSRHAAGAVPAARAETHPTAAWSGREQHSSSAAACHTRSTVR